MLNTLAFLLLAFTSGSDHHVGFLSEQVDLIELNHFYDPQGRHIYDQVIFYDRNAGNGKFHVRAWCLVEDREFLNRRPTKCAETGMHIVLWYDSEQLSHRKIKSPMYRESWSHIDPERVDRKRLDERHRLSLVQGTKRRQQVESKLAEIDSENLVSSAEINTRSAVGSRQVSFTPNNGSAQ